jgi:hypothetical protein
MAGQQPVEDGRKRPYVPAIPIIGHLCHADGDRRDKPGDDVTSFAAVTVFSSNPLIALIPILDPAQVRPAALGPSFR